MHFRKSENMVRRHLRRLRGAVRAVLMALLALTVTAGAAIVAAPAASAAFNPDGFDFWVDSDMGPIKSRVFRAADGNTDRVVYALDGMRAREDLNGWEIETEVARELTRWNINVVMPVGGQSSFYTDWRRPSRFLGVPPGSGSASGSSSGSGGLQIFSAGPGKSYTYMWETFLTRELRDALRDRLGFNPHRNGVFGLSMGGSAALTLAAYHPDQFSFAGSFSGYLNISAPGMRDALRVAMIDAGGYNVDAMALPLDPKWHRMDPFVFASRLVAQGTRLWVGAASGIPTAADAPGMGTVFGMALEALARVNTRAFQARMNALGATGITYDFPDVGIHAWNTWEAQVHRMLPDLSASIG